ncbi:hypothetical protein LWI29_014031 [Acer saccharum]|uniref:Uncharacterized protein n=1 Tax=Acer saccharum TaxID=4024 RepID=A0AA39RGN7_ACESA|nr:hypothetical protein LWI29_014031 [Acer saccharum]
MKKKARVSKDEERRSEKLQVQEIEEEIRDDGHYGTMESGIDEGPKLLVERVEGRDDFEHKSKASELTEGVRSDEVFVAPITYYQERKGVSEGIKVVGDSVFVDMGHRAGIGPSAIEGILDGIGQVVEDPNSISMAWIEDFMDLRSLLSNSNPLPDSVVKGSLKAQVDGVSKSGTEAGDFEVRNPKPTNQTPLIGKKKVDKGKGSWIKKARVKTVAIYDKTARIDLDKRLSEACGKEISKSEFSTSSESDLHMWKGEYSRRCFSGGLQSSSLDQILKAHSKSPSNGQDSKGAGLLDGCRPINVEMNYSKDLGSQFLCLSSNSSPNKEDCPSEEEGSEEEGECENWELQECDEGQMVVVQRKSDKDEGLFQNRIQKILLLVSV